jgi:hypothetical protein
MLVDGDDEGKTRRWGNEDSSNAYGDGEDADLWRALSESLADSEVQQERDAIEMSLNEEFMCTNGLESLLAEGDGVCVFV